MAFLLIPGAGGAAWYWHRVVPLLSGAGQQVAAVQLPADDDTAGLVEYVGVAQAAAARLDGPLIVVGMSMGAFTAVLLAAQIPAQRLVLVNPMIPTPGESGGQWWSATGQQEASAAYRERIGLGRRGFDSVEDFFHDVPTDVREIASSEPEPAQSDKPFEQPWPLAHWPDVPTSVLLGSEDRLFPLDFQRRLVRDRLGSDIEVEVMPGGHLMALSQPEELARRLLHYAS
jgi:pimeloyl-ACP methyl ester carboxylesterase